MFTRSFKFPEWKIGANRLDLSPKDMSERIFISFKNAGYYILDANAPKLCQDSACMLVEQLYEAEKEIADSAILRIGVRSTFGTEFAGTFDSLRERFQERYADIKEGALEILGGQLTDIGSPLYFRDTLGNYNTHAGPMVNDQLRQFLPHVKQKPHVGLFFDIDYWIEPNEKMSPSRISDKIVRCSDESWEKNRRLVELVLGKGK